MIGRRLTGDTANDDTFYARVGAIARRTGKPHWFIGFDGQWCATTPDGYLVWPS